MLAVFRVTRKRVGGVAKVSLWRSGFLHCAVRRGASSSFGRNDDSEMREKKTKARYS